MLYFCLDSGTYIKKGVCEKQMLSLVLLVISEYI